MQKFDKEIDVPEPASETATTAKEISGRGERRRFRWSRGHWIVFILAAIILIALIIGLAVGLPRKSYVGLNSFVDVNPI
jgi:type IV secretory pathway component VirB8